MRYPRGKKSINFLLEACWSGVLSEYKIKFKGWFLKFKNFDVSFMYENLDYIEKNSRMHNESQFWFSFTEALMILWPWGLQPKFLFINQ